MEPCNSCWGKKLKLATAVTLIATLLLLGTGCAKDVNPPVIQQAEMPEWVVDGENIDLSVRTADDRGVKEVYVQFDSVQKISLTKVDSKKDGEEVANWKASFKLSPTDYSYSIVVRDTANEARKEGKIVVYPNDADNDGIGYRDELKLETDPNKPNPVTKYLLDKNLGIYIPVLSYLDKDGVMDANEKVFVDLIDEYKGVDNIYPRFVAEFVKLPDLSVIDEKDDKTVEKIFKLAIDPQYKKSFEEILDTGVRDKRNVDTPFEMLYKGALSKEFDTNNPLINYSAVGMWDWFKKTPEWGDYEKKMLNDYTFATNRLITPPMVFTYMSKNFSYYYPPNGWIKQSPHETFSTKKGDCGNQSMFADYCLTKNGYKSCVLFLRFRKDGSGHAVTLYKDKDNLFYYLDNTGYWSIGIFGPFSSVEKAENDQISKLKLGGQTFDALGISYHDFYWSFIVFN